MRPTLYNTWHNIINSWAYEGTSNRLHGAMCDKVLAAYTTPTNMHRNVHMSTQCVRVLLLRRARGFGRGGVGNRGWYWLVYGVYDMALVLPAMISVLVGSKPTCQNHLPHMGRDCECDDDAGPGGSALFNSLLPQSCGDYIPGSPTKMGGDDEEIHQRELEEASKASTSFDQWEVQSVEGQISKPNPPAYEDGSQGLSKRFRISIIMGSVLTMIAVILAIAVFLPHSSKKQHDVCRYSFMRRPCRRVKTLRGSRDRNSGHGIVSRGNRSTVGNISLTTAIEKCLDLLEASIRWIAKSKATPIDEIHIVDIKAWLGAALTYQTDCNSAVRYLVNQTTVANGATELVNWVMALSSNALSMIHALDTYGTDVRSWKPAQPEETLNSPKTHNKILLEVPTISELIPNITVTRDGSSLYSSVQAAVNSAPDGSSERFIVYIKAGVYEEMIRIPPFKANIMLEGNGMDRTLVTGNKTAEDPAGSTYGSATVGVNGDGFVARDIAFENTQAVALRVDSDLSAFQNCRAFLGHHNTLYALALRHFYKDCRIEGTLDDFVFGNSAAVFQNCTTVVRPPQSSTTQNGSSTDVATAQGRTHAHAHAHAHSHSHPIIAPSTARSSILHQLRHVHPPIIDR
eukprot:Gb_23728 [translate_table: standard]